MFLYNAEVQSSKLAQRNEIEEKYKWDFTLIYQNTEEWQKDFDFVKSEIPKYLDFKSKLNSLESLLSLFKFDEIIDTKLEKLYLYSMLNKDVDLSNTFYQEMSGKMQSLVTDLASMTSFIRPEILENKQEQITQWLKENEEFAIYTHYFDDLYRQNAHSLDKAQEEILALAMPLKSAASSAFSYLKNTDIKHLEIEDENGQNTQLSDGRFYSSLYSPNRDFRKRAYHAYYEPIIEHKNTLSSLFTSGIKSHIFEAKARKYSSSLEAALKPHNIPLDVYHNLVQTASSNFSVQERWGDIKKKVLGLEELHPYDTYVSIFPEIKKKYSYEDGTSIVLKSLEVMGGYYIDSIKKAINDRRIDVFETQNKRSGAYSSGTTYGVPPYVLLNWNYQLNDVSTLTHELGHNMHSYFTGLTQPKVYAGYPIFLAEVASILNEALLQDYLMDIAETKEEKAALIEMQLNKYMTTFFRQTQFAEFELFVHSQLENGEAFSPDSLCKNYEAIYQKYWGNAITLDAEESYTWARVPHFYYGFYVYQYATGLAAAEALADRIRKEGEAATKDVMKFLSSGKSKYAIDILKDAGVDMSKPEPINAVINNMNLLLDELDKIS